MPLLRRLLISSPSSPPTTAAPQRALRLSSAIALVGMLSLSVACEMGTGAVEPESTPEEDAGGPIDGGVDAGELTPEEDAGIFVDGGADAGRPADGGVADGGVADGGAADGGAADAGPIAGFGAISGACGVLDDELESAMPFFIDNAIDFGADPFDDPVDVPRLTPGGQEIWEAGNAGGSSIESEIFAFEVLSRCDQARLLKTETEVVYTEEGKITDLLVEIGSQKVGVSVTRAVAFPFDDPYPFERAESLLNDKLSDVLESSALVAPEDQWVKQILHVIAYSPAHTQTLREAWDVVDGAVKADTIVYVTATNGDDAFLY